jgi:hypothetical protein
MIVIPPMLRFRFKTEFWRSNVAVCGSLDLEKGGVRAEFSTACPSLFVSLYIPEK